MVMAMMMVVLAMVVMIMVMCNRAMMDYQDGELLLEGLMEGDFLLSYCMTFVCIAFCIFFLSMAL